MKKLILILILIFFISVNCSSQVKHIYKKHLLFSKISPMAFVKSGIAIHKQDTLNITNVGVGISLTNGKLTNDLSWGPLPLVWSWKYKAIPFASLEYNFASNSNNGSYFQFYKPYDGATNFLLSLGVTAGIGKMFLILPFGINGTAAIATDFRDTYFKYGIAYDIVGLSIGFSKLVNLSNSNDSFYKTNNFLEIRLIWNWD